MKVCKVSKDLKNIYIADWYVSARVFKYKAIKHAVNNFKFCCILYFPRKN